MPFIGRDWRSPGEAWVKTETLGWQRMKLIESQLFPHPIVCSAARQLHPNHNQATCVSSWPPNGSQAHFESLGDTTTDSSANVSPCSSTSVSPTTSPHKTTPTTTTSASSHFIHPIAISSPYGHFSCTCSCATSRTSSNGAQASIGGRTKLNNSLSHQSLSTVSSTSSSLSSSSSSSSSTSDNHVDEPAITKNIEANISNKQEQFCHNCNTCCRQHQYQRQSTMLRPNRSLQSIVGIQSNHQGLEGRINQVDCFAPTSANEFNNDSNKRTMTADGRSSAPPQFPLLTRRTNNLKIDDSGESNGLVILSSASQALDDSMTDSNSSARQQQQNHFRTSPLFNKRDETIQYDNSATNIGHDENENMTRKKRETFDQEYCNSAIVHTNESASELNHVTQPTRSTGEQHDEYESNQVDYVEEDDADEDLGNISQDNKNGEQNQRFAANCCCRSNHHQQQQQYVHQAKESFARNHKQQPPFCRISVRTREVAMYNTISEAFYRLDFYNAIHDIRRFNYICKLLHLLITQNLTTLSGCATKILFTMLEQVAWEVSSNKRNIHVIKNLLSELKQMIQKYYCWGRPIGSSLLWQQHFDTIQRISQIVDGIELSPSKTSTDQVTFDKLPVEMVREILLRLNDYRDLVNSAQASPVMKKMINSQYIWKRMCRYHFTDQQVKLALKDHNRFLNGGSSKRLPNTRGIKYARTVTADGRGSFRNRVTRESSNENEDSTQSSTNRNQSSSSHRNANNSGSNIDRASSNLTVGDRVPVQSSTRLFENLPVSDRASNSNPAQQAHGMNNRRQGTRGPLNNLDIHQNVQAAPNLPSQSVTLGSNNDIDWGRIFHQLRKRFDLKEEYADCLLLCRHCRCLFWKSFGHPCVNDGPIEQQQHSCNSHTDTSQKADTGSSVINGFAACELTGQPSSRPSVASLSRDFDNLAQQSSEYRIDQENRAQLDQQNNSATNRSFRTTSNTTNQGLQNDALLRRLHERRVRLMNHRDDGPLPSSSNQGNVNPIDQSAQRNHRTQKILVPEHVTISPQAFLKFFSL